MKTGIYIRVSTEDQVKEGFSINAQKEKLTKYALLNEWKIIDYYIDDGLSGKNTKDRPEINRLLNDIKLNKINNVLVYKLDRLTRSVFDLITLINIFETYNCSFNSQTEKIDTSNAVGRMFIKMLGIFAEFERENLAERITLGYEQKTREGNYTNTNGVYGYNYIIGKGLIVNEEEKLLVNRIYNLYLDGDSFLQISKTLNKEKVPTKRGGKWRGSTIKSILTNPLYIGKVRYGITKNNNFITQGKNIKKIINDHLWNNVQELINKRKKYQSKKYTSDDAYYFRALQCFKCNSKFYGRQQIQNGKKYISYTCQGRKEICKERGFSHNKMETSFLKYLKRIENFKVEASKLDLIKEDYHLEKDCFLKKRKLLEKKKRETRELYLNNNIKGDEYQIILKKLNESLEHLNLKLKTMIKPKGKEIKFEDIKNVINNIRLNWEYLTNKERKIFLERFVKKIIVKKEDKEVKIIEVRF